MEAKFESLSLFEFQERFPDEAACVAYLIKLKWGSGFVCPNCGHTSHSGSHRIYDRQCTRCRHSHSPTLIRFFISVNSHC